MLKLQNNVFVANFQCPVFAKIFCLTQVQDDIVQLRQKWVQLRVDRVSQNTFQLYQVREQLKLSKVNLHFLTVFITFYNEIGAIC